MQIHEHADEFDGRLYNLDKEAVRMRDIQEGIRIYSIVTPVITYKGTTYQNLTVLLMELRRNIIAVFVCV